MSFLGKTIRRIGSWVTNELLPAYAVVLVDEYLPRQLERKTLYIVQEDGYIEQAAIVCPCGCKQILHMNMLPDERPCWAVHKHHDGSYSIQPSIWRQVGCKSHFWFRSNRIHWCKGCGPWWNRL